MSASEKKSLTDPPTNLKEAIDWVIKINGHAQDLAKELQELLKHDGSDVAMKVLDKYRLVSESVIEGLMSNKPSEPAHGFAVPHAILDKLSQGLDPFDARISAHISREKAKSVGAWASSVKDNDIKTLIEGLASGLKKFIGYQQNGQEPNGSSGIGTATYVSSYNFIESWNSLNPSQRRDCTAILLGIMPVVYIGLTYLYWQCEGKGGWATKRLEQIEDITKYTEAFGYTNNDLNESTSGGTIATQLKTAFSSEFQTAYTATQPPSTSPSYPAFLGKLHQNALKPSPQLTSSPLTSLYLLSHYYITNFLYTVETSSPATPSFAGYSGAFKCPDVALRYPSTRLCLPHFDCPSNLKEAIDWILRVTGKDGGGGVGGGGGDTAITALAGQVKELFDGVNGADAGLGAEFQKVKQALDGGRLITSLAEGLQQFIGYDASSNTNGLITGAGIAPSNIVTHRLCDAAIAFTIGVLEACKRYSNLNNSGNKTHLENVDKALKELYEKYGSGPAELKAVASSVGSFLKGVTGSNVGGFLVDIGTAFAKLKGFSHDQPKEVAQEVGEYLKGVFNQQWSSDGGRNIADKIQELGKALMANDAYDPGKTNSAINGVGGALKPKSSIAVTNSALSSGKNAFLHQLKKGNYTSRYQGYENLSVTEVTSTHAKIFLSCLPLIFNNLSYFYWQCRDGGPWQNQNLTGGSLSPFMEGHWFRNSYMNENMTGTSVVRNVMNARFPELQTASASKQSYSDFLKKFRSKGLETWRGGSSTVTTDNYLSALFYGASCYFQCQQIKNADKVSRRPHTIREMLYFLGALQFSSAYDEVEGHIGTVLKDKLNVADSSQKGGDNKLSAENM
ncbi:variant erythrocyte surface antigen-1 family protein [Babesia caballi]|uniref:Variant erythrocyte surface antigen-1 family protein n=1 Tax=Babesia caballi TaxID=5871 RepID=A0AAV4LXX2_BABCB|nr:variant erythrocyte surface antigen-1 family protein [Babesia caballi]